MMTMTMTMMMMKKTMMNDFVLYLINIMCHCSKVTLSTTSLSTEHPHERFLLI